MNTTQKALLSCSAVCYILTLYDLFRSIFGLTLLFFILHSVTLLAFSYVTYRRSNDPKAEEEWNILKEEYSRLTNVNQSLSEELNLIKKQNEEQDQNYRNTRAELESTLSRIQEQRDALQEELLQKENISPDSLLPPLLSEEDTQLLDIIQITRDTISEFLPFSDKAGIKIQISTSSDTLLVKADPQRIRILFRNIIDNSIKYMNRAGTLVITMSAVGNDIFIVLKDNGDGLSSAETPHIFEMNYQGSNRISGNGLGLTQAKAIVEFYGGTIYAKSTPGNGMGIYIQIPTE